MINQIFSSSCNCVDALSFFFGFNDLEVNLYFLLLQEGKKTVSQLCDLVSRNQSTVYTALEKLVSHSIVVKAKRSRETRGYEFVYNAIEATVIKDILKNRLDKLYTQLSSCLESFESDAISCDIAL